VLKASRKRRIAMLRHQARGLNNLLKISRHADYEGELSCASVGPMAGLLGDGHLAAACHRPTYEALAEKCRLKCPVDCLRGRRVVTARHARPAVEFPPELCPEGCPPWP